LKKGQVNVMKMAVHVHPVILAVVVALFVGAPTLAMKLQPSVVDRRHVLQSALLGVASTSLLSGGGGQEWMIPKPARAANTGTVSDGSSSMIDGALASIAAEVDNSYKIYKVFPDASATLNPKIATVASLPSFATSSGAMWLGEHHNSVRDHNLQAQIIRDVFMERQKAQQAILQKTAAAAAAANADNKVNKSDKDSEGNLFRTIFGNKAGDVKDSLKDDRRRQTPLLPMAVGLEQVQIKFQPVLDEFVSGKISTANMRKTVEWEKRWSWPFEVYEPIFDVCREFNIPLLALNVNSEDMALVERSGIPGLPRNVLESYILDRSGFASFARSRSFSTYVDYVIRPSYEIHQSLGLLKKTITGEVLDEEMPFRTFLSGRLLWDEAMACRAHTWTAQNPNGLLIGLVGADHVKFQNGIPARYARMAAATTSTTTLAGSVATTTSNTTITNLAPPRPKRDSITVLLNPTLIDTRPPGSVEMSSTPSTGAAAGAAAEKTDVITLQLRYYNDSVDVKTATPETLALPSSTGGVLPLADYLIIG
jgi:uncharacterized iron-regulated protein